MPIVDPASIRNIGIMAHIDAGKTTLSERILFYTRKIHKIGEVHDGAATMDFMPEEQERGITIASACSTCQWKNVNINLIDTPGHVDFTMEVQRCLRVLDGAVCVFCGVAGVEPQSETVWRQSENFHVPKLAFINKMDREGANFENVLQDMKARLGANPVPVTIPLGAGSDFTAVIDLINLEKLEFDQATQGRDVTRSPLSPEEMRLAAPHRDKMLEALAETDDDFMEKWLAENIKSADIHDALRKATISCSITPCLAGASLRNMGVQPLLDAISDYLPSPLEIPPAIAKTKSGKEIEIHADARKEPIGLIFKVVMEGSRKNTFMRLYSGTIHEGDILENARTGKKDRLGRILRLHADRREALNELGAGDIAAIVGLRDAQTGDTYASQKDPLMLESIHAYAPVITIALEPLNADEGKILDEALARYVEEDPTLKVRLDEDSGMRELSGMGELHLDITLERLAREYKINPRAGKPQAMLRETVMCSGEAAVNFDRELGKERHQGEVSLSVTPRQRGAGNRIDDYLPKDPQEAKKILPAVYRDAVHEALEDTLTTGVISGWPVTDISVHIQNIGKQEGATVPGLRMAAAQALREAMQMAQPTTLEPIMGVELSCPEEFLGPAINLFTQTGGHIEDIGEHGGMRVIKGSAPLRKLFGFSTPLRSATQGRAGFNMTFRNFDIA